MAKEAVKTLDEVKTASFSEEKPASLIDQIAKANQPTRALERTRPSTKKHAEINGPPIIIVPAAPSSIINMYNVKEFLQSGHFISVSDVKASGNVTKESSLFIERSKNKKYLVVDNPTRLGLEDWKRVVGVFVQGTTWQFKGWKWESPVEIFQNGSPFARIMFSPIK